MNVLATALGGCFVVAGLGFDLAKSFVISPETVVCFAGMLCVFAMPGSLTGARHVSGRLSSDVSVGILLGETLLTESPSLPRSNMDISDVVGAIDNESTASLPLAVLPMLPTRLGVLCIGLGLALLLAASVAAIKLGLLESTLG
jgi:hypothetical protein